MDNHESKKVRRTQRDYILGFKLAVVDSVGKGDMTYKQFIGYKEVVPYWYGFDVIVN